MAPPRDTPAFESSRSSDEDDAQDAERGLSAKEQSEVREAQRPRAPVVYEIIRLQGESELRRPAASLWWSGVAAGISIGFSFLSQAALGAGLPQSQWNHVIASFGYAVGFIIVILGRQQLFTENVLTAVLPVITRWNLAGFSGCCGFGGSCWPRMWPGAFYSLAPLRSCRCWART